MPKFIVTVVMVKEFSTDIVVEADNPSDAGCMAEDHAWEKEHSINWNEDETRFYNIGSKINETQ